VSTPEALRVALERRFRITSVDGHGSRLVSDFPAAAELAMSVVGPVLEARDAEIERLKAECDSLRNRPGERAIRADERWRCAEWLRDLGGEVADGDTLTRLADRLAPVAVESGSGEGERRG
jgi:hypothetical protein